MDNQGSNTVKTGGEGTWKSTCGGKEWDIGHRGKQTNDGALDLQRTRDGGFIVTGETFVGDMNQADVLVLKLDSDGLLIP
jgi:hypothetical protein